MSILDRLPRSVMRVLIATFACGALLAQTPTGTILGIVNDSSGAIVPGATVTVTQITTSTQRTTNSNDLGYYQIPLLPPGKYSIVAEHTGFKRFERSNLTLDTDQKLEIPVMLTPGDVQETVEVKGETPLLESTSSSVGQVIDNRRVVDLPLSNRNLLQLTGLVAGVLDRGADAAPATTGSVAFGRWSANGGMTNTNEFMLDGATAILANMNAASIIPTIDSIQEFKIQTSSMSAEYGRTGGAVINATYKSGTNGLHGTVYEFWKNRALNANTWLNNKNGQSTSFSNINTFGYSLGGPVIIPKLFDGRNKLFFFTNYEGYRDVNPTQSLLTVPTLAQRTGDFSTLYTQSGSPITIYDPLTTALAPGSTTTYVRQPFAGNIIPADRIDPVAAKLMGYYPLPNATPSNSFTNANNYLSEASGYDSQNEWAIKIDANLSDTKRLFSRYSQSAQGGGAANLFGSSPSCKECLIQNNPAGAYSPRGGGSALYIYPKNVVVGYTDTLSPTMVLDLRYSLNRQLLSRLPQSGGFDLTSVGFPQQLANSVWYSTFPPVSIQNYQGLGTSSNGDYLRRGDTTHAVQGSLTILRGAHTLKMGGDFRMFRYADIQAYNITPAFTFNQVWTQKDPFATSPTAGWSLASFLLGTPSGGTDTIPASVAIQWFYGAGYIQDDWRVSNRLTLNLGLRYDVETPFTERYNRTTTFSLTGQSAATSADPKAQGGLVFMGKDIDSRYRNPIDTNNFAPRIGMAYKITDSLVWRAAYGIFYPPTGVYGYGAPSYGANGFEGDTSMLVSSDGGLTPTNYLSNPFPGGFVQPSGNQLGLLTQIGQSISTQLRNVVSPYSQQYNAGLEYQFKSFLFGASYVGSHGVHQVINVPLDQLSPQYYQMGNALNKQVTNPFYGLITSGPLATKTISAGQLLRPFPQFQDVQNQYQTSGNMNYNSLQLKVEHRFSRDFSLLANYTWSKNIGDVGERYWASSGVQNQYDLRAERALSPFDTPINFTVAWLWELPFGKGKTIGHSLPAIPSALASGWQITGSYGYLSGTPLAISNPVNQLGFGAGSRPNNNGQSAVLPSSQQSPSKWFDTSVFSVPAAYTFGNVSHYSPDLRGAHTNNWNVSFFKDTSIGEKAVVEIRGEFYDFFNHPIWASPGTTVNTPTFGVVSQKSGNRTGQLGLKVIF
jgi:hypothetical protein